MKRILNILLLAVFLFGISFSGVLATEISHYRSGNIQVAKEINSPNVFVFGREDCSFCQAEEKFLDSLFEERGDFNIIYLNVKDGEIKEKFDKITDLYGLQKATPITLLGDSIIQGFNAEETTGELIITKIEKLIGEEPISLEEYLSGSKNISSQKDSVCEDEDSTSCATSPQKKQEIKIPILGVINLKDFSLLSMSVILGFVDGFNPCAMWVLLVFLLILWQIGDRKKMFQVAGLFILAEAVMYWLILNFWFSAWDFVGMDQVVTPAVGILAMVGGVYFLSRYLKNRKQLTCDITSEKYQSKTEQKIKKLISSPMTILTALGIVGIAFSVNIIEFACSVGIPQAFTKILEINSLGAIMKQFYILIYTLFYMLDDFIIFGLALYGFSKFYTVGQKYSNLSSLIGGILMLILGALLLFSPSLLVF